jgi:hypothetical protein
LYKLIGGKVIPVDARAGGEDYLPADEINFTGENKSYFTNVHACLLNMK